MVHEHTLRALALVVALAAAASFAQAATEVVSLTTPDDPTGQAVPIDGTVVVTFSDPVDPDTVNDNTFGVVEMPPDLDLPFLPGNITASQNDTVFTFQPVPSLRKGGWYQAVVLGADLGGGPEDYVIDAQGVPLAQSALHEFFTQPFTLTVNSIDPTDGQEDVPVDTDVTVTFSEPVDPSTVTKRSFALYMRLGESQYHPVEGDVALDGADPGNNTVFTFTPAASLAPDAEYLLAIISVIDFVVVGVTDPEGNGMADGVFQSSFQTAASTGDYFLHGFVEYEDTEYDTSSGAVSDTMSPVQYATMRFYDADGNPLDPPVQEMTGANGYFSHDFGDTNPGTITVKVFTEISSGNQEFYVKKQTADEVYSYEHPEAIDLAQTAVQNISITGAAAPAFNIYSVMTNAWAKITHPEFFDGSVPDPFVLTVNWESGVNNPRTVTWGRAVYYNDGIHRIDVPGDPGTLDDGFDDCILLEAYARFAQAHYSRDDAPGDRHYTTAREDRGYGVRLDLRQAWSEGWAHFFSSAVRDDPRSVYVHIGNLNVKFDIEEPKVSLPYNVATSGPDNQFGVASMLWYIYNRDKDNNPAKIWAAFIGMTQTATLEEFYRAWEAEGYAIDGAMDVAALSRGIKYQPDNIASSVGEGQTAPLRTVGGGTIDCTFYPAGDVDYFRFRASQGQEIKVTTSGLSCGADTVLTITDSDGFVLAQEIDGNPQRTWDDLDAAIVSSLKFTAPSQGTNDYFAVCRHSTEPLPPIDNDPDDGITTGSPANLGAYKLQIASAPSGVSVAQVDPADGQTDVPLDLEKVLIVFDGPVEPTTVTTDSFIVKDPDGDPLTGTISQVDPTNERYFEFVFDTDPGFELATSAEYAVEVTDGVEDPLGNGVTPFSSSFRTTGPFVQSVLPGDQATNVALGTTVTITFAAEVKAQTVNTTTFTLVKLDDQTQITGTVEQDPDEARKFVFTPDPDPKLFTSTEYIVVVTGVEDQNDLMMATPFSSTFTTETLKVVSWDPADGATDVPVTQPDDGIVITFNAPIDPDTAVDPATMISGTITLVRGGDTAVDTYAQVTEDRYTVILHPPAYFRGQETYTVTVTGGDEGVKDANGGTMATATADFTTGDRPAQQLDESVPRVIGARAYAGSGFIDIRWTNPFGDWGGLIIAGSTRQFPELAMGADNEGNPALLVTEGQVLYQGDLDRTTYRISGLQNNGAPVHINIWIVNGLDHSGAVSLESRAVAGGTGMPGATGEGGELEQEELQEFILSVSSVPLAGVTIDGTPSGQTPYAALLEEESEVTLTAPAEFQLGLVFLHWTVNDVQLPDGQRTITFQIFETTTARATYGQGSPAALRMSAATGTTGAGADGSIDQQPTDESDAGAATIDIPDAPSAGGPAVLEEPVVGRLPRPMRAKAGAGSGFVDVKWQVPDGVDGIIVAVGRSRFPQLKIARDPQGNSAFAVVGGAVIYNGGDDKQLRLKTPNGTICRFNLWTYSGVKVSRAVSLESRAVAGGTGLR